MAKSNQPLRRLILAAGVVLVVAFTGSAASDGWRLREQLLSGTDRELSNLARALADESARSLRAVDQLLSDTAAWYQQSAAPLDADAIGAALAARTVGVAQVSVLSIVDASGRPRFRSHPTGEPMTDVAGRPYFRLQRERPDAGMTIDEPIVTGTERLSGLVVSRRLNKPDGSFDGVVTAIVTLQRLQGMFSAIQLGDGSALVLALEDGTVVLRQPFAAGAERSIKFPGLVAFRGGPSMDRALSPMDGRIKLIAAVGVGDRPLTLAITRDEEVALRPWRDAMWGAGIRTLLMVLMVLLAMVELLRQLRRQELSATALRQSEERYAMAMEAADQAHAEWNVAADTVFLSDKWRALHGIAAHAPIAKLDDLRQHVVLHADNAAGVQTAIDDHLAKRTPAIEVEYRVRLPNDSWRWVHVRGRCLFDDAGGPLRLFCAAVDVSERKAAEADRAGLEARRQQTQRLQALGTLAGGIAHDFNNILGAILGFGQMAQQHAESDSAARRHIDRVLQAGGRARLLVRRILDFSRSGVAERVPVHFQAVVEEVMAMLRPSLPAGLEVSARLDAGHAAVIGDATQLYQVVMNICTNAVQATGESGSIELALQRVEMHAPKALLQGELAVGAYVRLDVADRGPGIAPDVLARMFDPFFTTKKVGEGTGLGLSVVHGIVVDLGGAIDVVGRDGGGTQVSIWLPIAGESAPLMPPTPSEWPRGNGEVVMVVDDERALVELAEELLAELGYEPVGFGSAQGALRAFEEDPARFDAVLTDETMPGLLGTELAAALLALRPDLPVILMSGNVGAGLEQRASDAKVAELLRKPLALQDLAGCLSRVLGARGPSP